MNELLISILLGIVEGLTEFLPVSSTAHLRIAQDLLQCSLESPYWKMYAVVIQLGAILAVVVYFWKRLWKFAGTFPAGQQRDRNLFNHPLSLTFIAFVVTAVPSVLLEKKIGENLESLAVMGWALVIGGVVMWVVDVSFRRPHTLAMEEMTFLQAVWVGLVQILSAVFPGTSRSMATISAGQMAGMSRGAALEFSFFLSIPVMVSATGYKLWKEAYRNRDLVLADPLGPEKPWAVLGVGFVVSFVVALVVIAWFMAWVRRRGFVPFAIYRILIGSVLLIWTWRSVKAG